MDHYRPITIQLCHPLTRQKAILTSPNFCPDPLLDLPTPTPKEHSRATPVMSQIASHTCYMDHYRSMTLQFAPPPLVGFHGAFATGVACQQGTLTLPDTWFCPPFWDLLMLHLLRPNSSNLPCLYSTFHLEYPLVLSRFCLE